MSRRKPLSELSPAYRARIERAIRKGTIAGPEAKRQAARGHVANESQRRRERKQAPAQTATGDLTPSQKGAVTKHAKHMATYSPELSGAELKAFIAEGQSWAARNGYARFVELRARQMQLRSEYVHEQITDTYSGKRQGYLDILTDEFEIDDIRWFYYH